VPAHAKGISDNAGKFACNQSFHLAPHVPWQ
jgi:hypothetical protein